MRVSPTACLPGVPLGELDRWEQALNRARAQLGEDGFRRAWECGHAMELEEAITYALNGGTAAGAGSKNAAPDLAESR